MPRDVVPWGLDNRITVVLFAGAGGACDGLEAAGFPVHLAINHDAVAVAAHAARHPHTRHLQQDVFEVDPRQAVAGRPVRILWASPDCRHFSRAKGRAPVSRRVRSLPWVVCRWGGTVKPEVIFTENVWELTTWGPLIARRDPATGRVIRLDGSVATKGERVPVGQQQLVPDPRRLGRTFRAWLAHLRGLGYTVEYRQLVCANYGIPTIRTRFFAVMTRQGAPAFPTVTHATRTKRRGGAKPARPAKALGLKPWVGTHTCIDWSIPCPSIFERKKPLAEATLRRIAAGVMRYVVTAKRPFLVPITHSGGDRVHSIDEPLRTVTTANRGEIALIQPTIGGALVGCGGRAGQSPPRGLNEPVGTITGKPDRCLAAVTLTRDFGRSDAADIEEPLPTVTTAGSGKTALVAAFLAQHNTGVIGRPADEPLSTITTSATQKAVVATHLTILRGTSKAGRLIDEPAPALTAGGSHVGLVAAFIQQYYSSGGQDQDARDPLGAVTTKARHAAVTVRIGRETMVISDIGMRMLEPEECARAHEIDPASLNLEITIAGRDGRPVRRRLTKTEKYRLVGDSVPPRMAKLLALANVRPALTVEAAE